MNVWNRKKWRHTTLCCAACDAMHAMRWTFLRWKWNVEFIRGIRRSVLRWTIELFIRKLHKPKLPTEWNDGSATAISEACNATYKTKTKPKWRYNYRVLQLTDAGCPLVSYEISFIFLLMPCGRFFDHFHLCNINRFGWRAHANLIFWPGVLCSDFVACVNGLVLHSVLLSQMNV